ncbi:MAG: hypothetical protein SCAL_000295 [Candidatus Syntrophoarchaeum caldarius]|uniref:Uncharacterized protein n=1 Tax=Candidatus Syntropharchaeum caldarium TaxID=1838285 RepID=A0A1F2PB31_9EURY|nr:MAG: hypothetical protein SCAL_000295 [Candidatus Syntrophoarchaeum caldarius]
MEKDRECSGQISIDFLIGISLFLLTLVFLVQFIPTVFVSFGSESIDLSSVAYRTSVILVEDPGCWNNSATLRTESDWENHVDRTTRVGLAIDKNHPNILNLSKIEAFADTVNLPDSNLSQNLVLYRKIGGNDIFYGYNITLTDSKGNRWSRGETLPQSGNLAKVERLTLINTSEYGWIDTDKYFLGAGNPSKALIRIPNSSVAEFCNDDLYFYLTNFNITGANPKYVSTKMVQTNISNETGDNLVDTGNGIHIKLGSGTTLNQPSDGYTRLNGVYQGDLNTNVDINSSTDLLELVINQSAFTRAGFNITDPVSEDIFIEFNLNHIECEEEHFPYNLTCYNDTLQNVHRICNLEVLVW